MQLTNSTGWRDTWVRKLVCWVAKQVEYDAAWVTSVTYSFRDSGVFTWRVAPSTHAFHVRVNPVAAYPVGTSDHPHFEMTLGDHTDTLVYTTASALAWLERWDRVGARMHREGRRDRHGRRELARAACHAFRAFSERKADVLRHWGEPGPGPAAVKVVYELRCRRCGEVWRHRKELRNPARRSCGRCFRRWREAGAAGEFLLYRRAFLVCDQERAFLEQLLEDPGDDVTRLAYADWLEERGEGEGADFLRQLTLTRVRGRMTAARKQIRKLRPKLEVAWRAVVGDRRG